MKKKKEEKKNLQKYLPIITLIIIGILLILIIGIKFFKKDPLIKGKFTYLGTYEEEKITNEYYKITRQEKQTILGRDVKEALWKILLFLYILKYIEKASASRVITDRLHPRQPYSPPIYSYYISYMVRS